MGKPLLIFTVHLSEVLVICQIRPAYYPKLTGDWNASTYLHISQEDSHAHDLANIAAGRLEDGFEVLAAGCCFLSDAAFDQSAVCVGGDLPRYPDLASSFDGLAVGTSSYQG